MLISVVIPTYNRAALLRRTLESVFAQTYPELEILVVDDGSTDDTEAVVKEFAARGSRPVRYIRQENAGCAAARNAGVARAEGEAVIFLDSDDTWTPTAVEQLACVLDRSGADFVYSPAIEVDQYGGEWVNPPVAAGRPEALAVEHFRQTNVRNGAVLFRVTVFERVGRLDERLRHNEDSDFLQRAAIRCRAAYCDTPTVRVMNHPLGKSRNRAAIYRALLDSAERVLRDHPDFSRKLGEAAGQRVHELRRRWVEALIAAGAFSEARREARGLHEPLGMRHRLALWLRSARLAQ